MRSIKLIHSSDKRKDYQIYDEENQLIGSVVSHRAGEDAIICCWWYNHKEKQYLYPDPEPNEVVILEYFKRCVKENIKDLMRKNEQ